MSLPLLKSHKMTIYSEIRASKIVFALIFSIFQILFGARELSGQQGQACTSSIPIAYSNTVFDSISTQSKWYSFIANDSTARIVLHNLSDATEGHLHEMRLYGDSCSNLTLLSTSYARTDSGTVLFGYSDSLAISTSELIVGRTYYINLDRESSQLATCRTCNNNSSQSLAFSLTVLPLITPNAISFSGSQCIWPDCQTDQSGFVSVAFSGTFRIQASQSGPFNYFSNTAAWVFFIDNTNPTNQFPAVDANGNSLPITLSNGTTYSVYLNARVSCTAIGGQTDILSFILQRENILNNWNTVASTTYSRTICESAFASNAIICVGGSVTLSAIQANGPYSWAPSSSVACPTCQSTIATPTVTTTYTLTVGNPSTCCPSIQDHVKVIVDAPTAYFNAVNQQCVGVPVLFFNNSTGAQYYYWDFGDGSPGITSANPQHIYAQPGQYTVTLLVNSGTCTAQYSRIVDVTPSTSTYNPNCCSSLEQYIYNGSIHLATGADVTSFMASFTSNPTLNSFVTIKDTLFIENNLSVVLTGKQLGFGPWGKIIIAQGAELVLDNCLLFPSGSTHDIPKPCPVMWQGVEVWGDASKGQSAVNPATGTIYQGKVVVKNNTIIRDAHNAIIAGRWGGSQFLSAFGGGIVDVSTGCQFINNGYGIRFLPYPYVSISRIRNSSFMGGGPADPGYNSSNSYTYPNQYNVYYARANSTQRTYAYIQAIGIKNVRIEGNSFNNAEYGIIGINSLLSVGGASAALGNTFTNITNGEVHGNFFNSPFNNNKVERNSYQQCLVPIQTWNGIGDRISKNIIPNAFVAIGSVSSRAITINDNDIGSSLPSGGCLVGVSASNSGIMGGTIGYSTSGNLFTKCVTGTLVGGNNPNLQIHCNRYDNQLVTSYNTNWVIGGNNIASQGNFPFLTEKDPAGNFFLQYSPLRNQIASSLVFNYYAHSTTSLGIPQTVIPTPVGSPVIVLTAQNMSSFATACDPGPPCPTCFSSLAQMSNEISVLESEKVTKQNNLDNGQTQVLLNAINSNMSCGQLKNLLLANSPLSDTVLLAYISKIGTPPGLFKDVVIPNSPVSLKVLPLLQIKVAVVPNGIKNQILAAQTNYANRTLSVVDAELSSKTQKRQMFYNDQQTFYVDQFEVDSSMTDSIGVLLVKENTEAAKAALVSSYIEDKKYDLATSTIANMTPTTSEEQAEKGLLVLLNTIYSGGRDIFTATSAEIAQVRSFAEMSTDCSARASARIILFTLYGEPLEMDLIYNTNREVEFLDSIEFGATNYLGECYPNPATSEVSMQCNGTNGKLATMLVYDASGKLVYSEVVESGQMLITIPTSTWVSGIYLCSLRTTEEELGQQKFIIDNIK